MRLLASLFAALVALAAPTARAATDVCSALPYNTFSHSCSSVCPTTNHTCVVYDAAQPTPCNLTDGSPKSSCVTPTAALTTNKKCIYECFAPEDKDPIVLRFYILFNSTRGTKAPGTANTGDTTLPPYESNEFVRRIGVLELPTFIAKVIFSGGRNEDTATRGDVVDVEIDPATFSKTPNLTVVGLLNMDIGGRLPDFPSILPKDVRAVDVTNANLKQIPTSLNRLTLLQSISFQRNLITEVPAELNVTTLETMFLGENELTSFNVVFPMLKFLDIANNKLQEFPWVVFNMTKLSTLRLGKNPLMKKFILSTSQYAQLSKFEEFSIDEAAMDNSSCRADQIKTFRAQSGSVCVVSDEELAAYIAKNQGAKGPSTSSPSTAPSSSDSGGMSTAVIAVIIVVAVVVIAGVGGFVYMRKRRQLREDEDTGRNFRLARMQAASTGTTNASGSNGTGPFKKARHAALLLSEGSVLSSGQSLWDDEEMIERQIQLEDIEDVRVIGSGGFAIVWLVKYIPQNRLLASKRLIKDQVTRQRTMEFVIEIKLNMQLEHPNIVALVGVAWTIETDLQALLEYMPNGDLRSHLETTAKKPLPPWTAQKLQLAIDVIEALVYVHSFSPPLVHRDLKSRNVLLADDMKAKLCDFGVSRFASENKTMTTGVGTGKWLAPEVVAGSTSYNESCDIYSFGVVLSEIDTHQLPYDDIEGTQGHKLPEVAVLQMVASGQLQPTISSSCPDAIRDVAFKCLAFTPADRPTAMEVAYWLRLALRAMQSP